MKRCIFKHKVDKLLEDIGREGESAGSRGEEKREAREEKGGGLPLISLHVCHAVFLQGFLVSFSRHQSVHSRGSDANGSVKGPILYGWAKCYHLGLKTLTMEQTPAR